MSSGKKNIKIGYLPILLVVVFIIVFIVLYSAKYAIGQVMSGASYKIQSDSLNFGGGFSTSSTYFIQDTVGEVATGESASSNFKMKAGYQNMQENILSLSVPTNVILSPSIGGISGGVANGSTTFTVITDSPAGYYVTIKASTSPAMISSLDNIADYSPSSAGVPDYSFASTSSTSRFGFTVEGNDTDQKFKDNGVSCNAGSSNNTDACWLGLSTTAQTIVSRASANQPAGTVTTLKFRAQSGSAHVQVNGNYVATTTITALSL